MSAIDPQAAAVRAIMTEGPPLNQRGVAGTREWARARAVPPPAADPRLETVDRRVNGVPIRHYRLVGQSTSPVIMMIHGGGWVIGDLDGVDNTCRELCRRSGAAVVSVDYRLAPEHVYPAALEDCLAVLRWIVDEGSTAGIDASRICVAGESSGGQLAAATCLEARERSIPGVRLQLLVCPVIDSSMDTKSWAEFGDSYLPVAEQMSWMWDLYAGSPEVRIHPRVSLAEEKNLANLPQAIILTAEYDPLRDEGEEYGRRLAEAGVPVEVRRIDGQVHTIFGCAAGVDRCRLALSETAEQVGRLLAPPALAATI